MPQVHPYPLGTVRRRAAWGGSSSSQPPPPRPTTPDGEDDDAAAAEFAPLLQLHEGAAASDNRTVPWLAFMRPAGRNRVSLVWEEKLLLLAEFTQAFAVIRLASPDFPWPLRFRNWTRWALLANLDYPAFVFEDPASVKYPKTAPWPPYALLWMALLALLGLWLAAVAVLHRARHRRPRAYYGALRACCFAGQLLYTPLLVALPRIVYHCEMHTLDVAVANQRQRQEFMYAKELPYATAMFSRAAGATVTEQALGSVYSGSTRACFGLEHAATAAVYFALAVPVLVWMPAFFFRATQRGMVFGTQDNHETQLQSLELEYLLGANDHWRESHCWVFSSFRRAAAWHYLYAVARRWALVGCLFLPHVPRAVAMFGVVAFSQAVLLVWPSYRCSSSARFARWLGWVLTLMAFSGLTRVLEVRSFFLVDTSLQWGLLAVAALGLGASTALVLRSVQHARARPPSASANDAVCPGWPVTTHDAELVQRIHGEWVSAVRHGHRLIRESLRLSRELVDPIPLIRLIGELERYRELAEAERSLLFATIDEVLHDLVIALNSIEDYTLLPNPELQALLSAFNDRIRDRRAELVLMKPIRQRLLLKLLAVRCFLVSGEDTRARRRGAM